MDLREYEHISSSPNTFPRSTLESIKKSLQDSKSHYIALIDKILSEGYIKPPPEYKWHGCYRLILSVDEMNHVLNDLVLAKKTLINHSSYTKDDISYIGQYIEYWSRAIYEQPVSYEEAIKEQQYYDLRDASLDDFTKFIFDHDVPENDDNPQYWYYDFDMWIDYNKDKLIDLYIGLFNNSIDLVEQYTKEQLDQGCWAMMGPNLEVCLEELIWDENIARAKRVLLIYAMYGIYKNLYDKNPLGTSCDMWWDSLAYDFYDAELRNREDEGTRIIQDAMFSTLKKILDLDSEYCKQAALHGLGHLRHPDTKEVIEKFIKNNRELSKEQINYAKACITGDIM